jgi:hypothetical protein
VLRAVGETESTQENIQDWLELDEGDPGFQLLTEKEISAVIYIVFLLFSSALPILSQFQCIYFVRLSFMSIFWFFNPDNRLILMTPDQINPDYRGFTVFVNNCYVDLMSIDN